MTPNEKKSFCIERYHWSKWKTNAEIRYIKEDTQKHTTQGGRQSTWSEVRHWYLYLITWKHDGTYSIYNVVFSGPSPGFRHIHFHPTWETICRFVLNLLVKRRKDIVRRMCATSVQVEPVQSSTTQNGWGFINLQRTT